MPNYQNNLLLNENVPYSKLDFLIGSAVNNTQQKLNNSVNVGDYVQSFDNYSANADNRSSLKSVHGVKKGKIQIIKNSNIP